MAGVLLSLIVGAFIIGVMAGAMWLFVTVAKAWRQNAQDVLGASRSSTRRRRQLTTADEQASSQADQSARQDDA